uniref:Nonsense-mediated mRNA decay factor SMG8 n=1 Tax=Romanomermis culicivorax TaxID=13658 RepID=A0A915K0L2_ROMCU
MAEEISTFLKQALDELSIHRENKVCVISIVSKSALGENLSKVALLNQLVEKQMFTSYASMKKFDNCSIEVFFDADNQCIFLNFQSPYELNSFEFRRAESENYHQWWMDKEKQVVAHLLYLFSISQIVLFLQPTCRFDLSYLRLFRNLNYLREKCLTSVQDILSDITSVPKGWSKEGRAGCPRVLFLFSRPPSFMKPDGTVETRKGSYKKLAACLEDQIFRLFRKSRIVTNNSSISICSLPSKQSFCYIFGPNEEPKEFGREILSNLSCSDDKKNEYEDYGFKNFFFDHVDLAFSSGFDDNA